VKNGKMRPYEPLLMTLHRLGDALLGACLFLFLSWFYEMFIPSYLIVAVLIVLLTLLVFQRINIYHSWRVASLRHEIDQILIGCIIVYILLLLIGYSLKVSHEFSRRVVITWMVSWPVLLGLERYLVRAVLWHYREKGYNIRRTVIAGVSEMGERVASWVDENPWSGARVVGFFDDWKTGNVKSYPILGTFHSLPEYVKANNIDTVYIAISMKGEEKIQALLAGLADTTASVYLVPDIFLYDLMLGGNLLYFDETPVISLRETPLQGFNSLLKRTEDIVLSLFTLLLTSPLMLLVAIGIKLTSRGPVLFKQWRYGLDGQPIEIYKFQTMTVCEDGYEFKQAVPCDPRVTRLGTFLRRTSLDELPQIINVLQGRMSIVGPRPHPVALNESFRQKVPGYMLRHKVRPGITGLAQVNGWRGETDTIEKMEKRIEYDLEYLRQWSLFLDLKIIALTIWNGAWRTNAY
jgi:putative colanic acid biosysnthesis UDP-glucose lipid carrier transferase